MLVAWPHPMNAPCVFRMLLVPLTLAACSKSGDEPSAPPAPAASEVAAQEKARAETEARKRAEAERKKADEEATRVALADEAEAEAKARAADQNAQPFHGRTAAQLKEAARHECRAGRCDTDVLDQIFEAARPQDSESVRCVVRFEEDSWMCRQGINPALCNPPPCP
jgi:hypothetical protein